MDVKSLAIDKDQAAELYRKYQTHKHYETELDREIKRAYKEIAKGSVVIQAIEAVKRAGLNEDGLPKLALARATAKHCYIERVGNGRLRNSRANSAVTTWINSHLPNVPSTGAAITTLPRPSSNRRAWSVTRFRDGSS